MPERFDPSDPLFKTPDGKDRHPMAFIPFFVGERKCLGYMFAKAIIPSLVSKLHHLYDFEFVDAKFNENPNTYPIATSLMAGDPPIGVRIKATDKLKDVQLE